MVFSHLAASGQPGNPCFMVLALKWQQNSSWREGDRIMISEVTYSKTVLWEKYPLTTFQQHSLAILKSADFSVHTCTCGLCN